MDAKNCLATLEVIQRLAENGDLQGHQELVKEVTDLQRYADDQYRQGNTKYYHVSVAASEALTLVSSVKAGSFDEFTVDRVILHGAQAIEALEDLISAGASAEAVI